MVGQNICLYFVINNICNCYNLKKVSRKKVILESYVSKYVLALLKLTNFVSHFVSFMSNFMLYSKHNSFMTEKGYTKIWCNSLFR